MKKFIIITGYYGTGKTNLALNLAFDLKKQGKNVTLVDLDIVNPYFRSDDLKEKLELQKINFISTNFANTNLDVPSISPVLNKIFNNNDDYIIIDVGGDDSGAVVLGSLQSRIKNFDYEVLFVVNYYRYLDNPIQDTVNLIKKIEQVSRLKISKIVNNSNVFYNTKYQDILDSKNFIDKIIEKSNLPLECTCVKQGIDVKQIEKPFIVDIYVKPPWEN